MSRILITGGSGTLGQEIVQQLETTSNTVRIMSRKAAPPDVKIEWAQADLETGEGITEALRDVDIIINSASQALKANKVDIEGTRQMLAQARSCGVKHIIHISIVGIDRLSSYPYYQSKLEAEKVIMESGMPYSIARITQFHTLLDTFLSPLRKLPWTPLFSLPPTSLFQLIDPSEAAEYLMPFISEVPTGRIPDVGGPEVLALDEIAKLWLKAQNMWRPHFHLPIMLRETGEGLRHGYNTVPENKYGQITWADYLETRYGHMQSAKEQDGTA
ncbi:MAG: NAD(P)H-binding protein [Anaerolineae bacterium]